MELIDFLIPTAKAAGLLGELGASDAPMATIGDFSVIIINIMNIMFALGGAVVLAMILWGAFNFFTTGGDQAKAQKAKGIILNALIGGALIIGAAMIVELYVRVLGGKV